MSTQPRQRAAHGREPKCELDLLDSDIGGCPLSRDCCFLRLPVVEQPQRESRIIAAIEISRNYVKETPKATKEPVIIAKLGGPISPDEVAVLTYITLELEYIAFLANNKRINVDYLDEQVKCIMIFASEGWKNIKQQQAYRLTPINHPHLDKFVQSVTCPIGLIDVL
jgi:hypothetical protein